MKRHMHMIGVLLLIVAATMLPARADTIVNLRESFAGNMNFVMTGGTLRTDDNNGDACDVTNFDTATLSGIPGGATIVRAYLYYAGSGTTVDANVTFNGSNIAADRTFTASYSTGGTTFDFFSGAEDVTALVTGNGNYSFSNLTVDTGFPWCNSEAVLSGWSLIVIYEDASEDFRVVNLFDGFQSFRGQSITLTPANFQIPVSPINGKHGVITWEGDVENSADMNGESEDITFNGTDLTDALDPAGNQFNSTINQQGIDTSYGVDIDSYDVDALLNAGDTSATTVYSSGADLVILSAEVMSITNTPVSDLSISKTHSGDFTVGQNGVYTLQVTNNGPNASSGTTTVSDTLPAGLSYVSASGSGWNCGAVGQTVTCTYAASIANGASPPAITLTVGVGAAAYPSVSNTATVSGGNFDNQAGNDSASDPTSVQAPDLSTSTKTVVDLNGGEADPGDTLRYTITLNETGGIAATGAAVTDDIPALTPGFTVVSVPAGATDASTGIGTGANGTGYLNVTGIDVPANGSVSIEFDVTISGGANPGDTIDNTATVTPASGAGASPSAPTITVSASQLPASGNKLLYLYSTPSQRLSRTPPIAAQPVVSLNDNDQEAFTMAPVAQAPIEIASAPVVDLYAYESGTSSWRYIEVRLYRASDPGTYFSDEGWHSLSGNAATPSQLTLTLNDGTASAPLTLAAGDSWVLEISNDTGNNNRYVHIAPHPTAGYSHVTLDSNDVINVDSIAAYSSAYPGVGVPPYFTAGDTVYLRAVVSDPFGSFDITGATIDIDDANGTSIISGAAMTEVADSGALTKTYEYAYNGVPATGPGGWWSVTVTAAEGTEGTVSDDGVTTFQVVLMPNISLMKFAQVLSDPINGASNPKAVPGAVMAYSITATNSGLGSADAGSIVIRTEVPPDTTLYVDTGAGDPVAFADGTTPSGLVFNYATDVAYSNQPGGGAPYNYSPVPDVDGYDANVTGIQVVPGGGDFNPSSGAPHPAFSVSFRVRVD